MKTYRKAAEKPYRRLGRGCTVDKRIPLAALDEMNLNRRIQIIGVCSGHNQPTDIGETYRGNIPEISLHFTGDRGYIDLKKPLKLKCICEKIRKGTDAEMICKQEKDGVVRIRGIKREDSTWWNKVAKSISKI